MYQNRKYFGITGTQIGILAGMAFLVLCLFGVLSFLVFGNGFSLGGSPEQLPTPNPTATLVVIPTATPTALPTLIPYEQLIPAGWTQFRTALVELWLPSSFKTAKANSTGLTSLAASELHGDVEADGVFPRLAKPACAPEVTPEENNHA